MHSKRSNKSNTEYGKVKEMFKHSVALLSNQNKSAFSWNFLCYTQTYTHKLIMHSIFI